MTAVALAQSPATPLQRLTAACARMRTRAQEAALALYEITRSGYVTITLSELAARMGRGRSSVQAAVAELCASGMLVRRHTSSSEYKWHIPTVDKRAKSHGTPGLRLVESPEKACWLDHYRAMMQRDKRYWRKPVPPGRPTEASWKTLLDFGSQMCADTGATLDRVAWTTCERFRKLEGKTAEKGHPLVFLAGDLAAIAARVKRDLTAPKPKPKPVEFEPSPREVLAERRRGIEAMRAALALNVGGLCGSNVSP